jgi:aldehyde oxidoreductase
MNRVAFTLNGRRVLSEVDGPLRLAAHLRRDMGCKDVKIGCDAGDCGACTVLLDGAPICACITSVSHVDGRQVETLAGLRDADPLFGALAQSFLRQGAAQCGICTPGMMVSAIALLREDRAPDEAAVKEALGGVLCRCTGYRKIIDAVRGLDDPATVPGGRVGDAPIRLDGPEKVAGREAFGDDLAPDDALVLRVIRAPDHHCSFTIGDTDGYARRSGLDLVLTAQDVPGLNRFGVLPGFVDQPVFAEGAARFKGEAVAAVVGRAALVEALDLADFPVVWQAEEALMTPEAAEAAPALLHEARAGNVMCRGMVQCGDTQAALARADVRAEGFFATGFVEHAYIEPEAGYAEWRDGGIAVYGCTQAPFMDKEALEAILDMPGGVRIVPSAVGGGFGSKLDLSFQPFVALAALKLRRAVRITYGRGETMATTTKRHPSEMWVKAGAGRDGRLSGFSFEGRFNTGAYASWGPTVANRVPVHAGGPYAHRDYVAQTRAVHTHSVPAGAFRGFGVPQAAIAQEAVFDDLANQLGIDRLEFRVINALDNGVPTVTGQIFDSAVGIKPCLEALRPAWDAGLVKAAAFNADAAALGGALRKGVGVACGWYGCGNTSLANPSTIKAGVTADGRVVLHQGAMDIGQGSNTVIAQIFAESLGVDLGAVRLVGADTGVTPDAGKTSASRQTFVSGNAAARTGADLRAQILRLTNATDGRISFDGDMARVTGAEGAVHAARLPQSADAEGYVLMACQSYDPPTRPLDANGQGIPYAVYGYTAQMAELTVDTELGTVTLDHIHAAHDVGRAINPVLVEGQVHGGVAQGIGMALMEEFFPGRGENLHDYLIPTIGDVPPITTHIIEVADPNGPYGAKGLGEHVLIPTAPAILNAIHHATGARVTWLPATPDKVMAALGAMTGG